MSFDFGGRPPLDLVRTSPSAFGVRRARAWTLDHLLVVQAEVLAADKACKTSGSPDQLISERLALQIAGKARRLGL